MIVLGILIFIFSAAFVCLVGRHYFDPFMDWLDDVFP